MHACRKVVIQLHGVLRTQGALYRAGRTDMLGQRALMEAELQRVRAALKVGHIAVFQYIYIPIDACLQICICV